MLVQGFIPRMKHIFVGKSMFSDRNRYKKVLKDEGMKNKIDTKMTCTTELKKGSI